MVNRIFSSGSLKTALIVFVLCLGTSMAVTFSFFLSEEESRKLKLEADLSAISNIVSNLVQSVHSPVTSIGAVISANHSFKRGNETEDFHRYIESKALLENYPSVIAWSYAKVFDPAALEEEVARVNDEPGREKLGYGQMKIFPEVLPGDQVAAATMAAPKAIADQVLGYNILSNSLRRDRAYKALEEGKMLISQRIELKTKEPGVITFFPVYKTSKTPQTVAERQANVIGYMMAVFSTKSLFASVKDQFDNMGLDVEVHDVGLVTAAKRAELNYSTLLSSSRIGEMSLDQTNSDALFGMSSQADKVRDIEVAGRVWRIAIRYQGHSQGATYMSYTLTALFMLAGVLLSVLSSFVVYSQLNARKVLAENVAVKTRALREAQKELEKSRDAAEQLSLTDSLTGLANRRALQLGFDKLMESESDERDAVSIALIDIDFFKTINDTYGHEIGDAILTSFSSNVTEKLNNDKVCFARLGGDEFAALFSGIDDTSRMNQIGQLILQAAIDAGKEHSIPGVTASIGVAKMKMKSQGYSGLMKNADVALYEAKAKGRACVVNYTKSLIEETERKDRNLKAADGGLERDEFVPVFQPYIDLATDKVIGFEVLARWQHKTKGLLSPGKFWDALCDEYYATRISNMVMKKAFAQAGELKKSGLEVGRIGINVTTQMLEDRSFAKTFVQYAMKCGLSADNLKIEVTERTLLSRNSDKITKTLEKLSGYGVLIAFDDFGTGFASLIHLRSFPLHCVKIDRSFVQEMETEEKSRAIVSGVIKLAHDLGFSVVAEGTETDAQRESLIQLGCEASQGFLHGRPGDIEEMRNTLSGHSLAAA